MPVQQTDKMIESKTFESFEKSLVSNIDILEDVIQLRDSRNDESCVTKLQELNEEVETIHDNMTKYKSEISNSMNNINQIKDAYDYLEKLKLRLTHMLNKIPGRLPRTQREPPVNNAPAPTKVQSSVSNQLQPCGDSKRPKQAASCPSTTVAGQMKQKVSNVYVPEIEFLTVHEFESIPKYLKGRLAYDQVNKFVESLNKSYEGKYKLMKQKVSKMNQQARQKYDTYQMQETKDTKGCYFVTGDDLKELGGQKQENTTRVIVPILRHVGRLKEVRGGGITRFVYIDNY